MSYLQSQLAAARRGATIIEVLFAVGILLFGLVGIAALIPAAAKLSRSSIDLDRGSAIGQAVSAQFTARGLAKASSWQQIADTGATADWTSTFTTADAACIDPLFVMRPENIVASGTTMGLSEGAYEPFPGSGHNCFRRSVFPYYVASYNPLIDPANPMATSPWPSMPRIARVTTTTIGSSAAASELVDDVDQLVFDPAEDDTMPPTQMFRPADLVTAGDTAFPGTRSGRPEYSWFATIQPTSSGFGRASVAVVRSRDRTFYTPPSSGTALIDIGVDDPRELQERVAYVSAYVANFSGGAGGTIMLTATQAVESDLDLGGWVMLMRNVGTFGTPDNVHAWYRIVHADREATMTTVTDPVGSTTREVWQRSVTLEGPDWIFEGTDTTSPWDNTLAVLVDGVVSVHEFPVKLAP